MSGVSGCAPSAPPAPLTEHCDVIGDAVGAVGVGDVTGVIAGITSRHGRHHQLTVTQLTVPDRQRQVSVSVLSQR